MHSALALARDACCACVFAGCMPCMPDFAWVARCACCCAGSRLSVLFGSPPPAMVAQARLWQCVCTQFAALPLHAVFRTSCQCSSHLLFSLSAFMCAASTRTDGVQQQQQRLWHLVRNLHSAAAGHHRLTPLPQMCAALACTYPNCSCEVYHQVKEGDVRYITGACVCVCP